MSKEAIKGGPAIRWIATDKGVKKMLVSHTDTNEAGTLWVYGKVFHARSQSWTLTSRWWRVVDRTIWLTETDARHSYKDCKAAKK